MRCAALLAAVPVLAGCGAQHPGPSLPGRLAVQWQRQADSVANALAAGDPCLARRRVVLLQTSVIAAVNARRIASQFQEPLVGAVNELVSRVRCPA